MKRPKVRIGTLMLLVAIAALAVELLMERRRSGSLSLELDVSRVGAEAQDDVLA